MEGEKRPRIGVGVLVRRGNEALFLKRKGAHGEGTWSFPGGHLEWGETVFSCALREAEEETGVKCANPRFLAITEDFFENEGKQYITVFVGADYVSGEAANMEPHKCDAVAWFPIDSPPGLTLFTPTKNVLEGKCFPSNWRAAEGL